MLYRWNDEKAQELLNIVENKLKNGETIKEGVSEFCRNNKDVTEEKAISKYYRLISSKKYQPKESNDEINPWNKKEEEELINFYNKQTENGFSTSEIFNNFAKMKNRTFNSVAGRYYYIQKKKNNPIDYSSKILPLLNTIDKIDLDEISNIVDKLAELQEKLNDQESTTLIEYFNLKVENEKLKNRIKLLEKENSLLKNKH